MSEVKIPKARLLTMREVIGVDNPKELGFESLPTEEQLKLLEELSDQKSDKLNVFKTRGILCSSVMKPYHRYFKPTPTKSGNDIIEYPSAYRVKNDYPCLDEIRHLCIGRCGNFSFTSDQNPYGSNIRVAFTWSEIEAYCQNIRTAEDGVIEAEYGLWPIDDTSEYDWLIGDVLEPLYKHHDKLHILKPLPLKYTTEQYCGDMARYDQNPAFEYFETKFARIGDNDSGIGGRYTWLTLKPLTLWVDKEKDVAVTAYTIGRIRRYDDIEEYLEKTFSKEVFDGATLLKSEQQERELAKEREKVKHLSEQKPN